MFPSCTGNNKPGNKLFNPSDPAYWLRTAYNDILARSKQVSSDSIVTEDPSINLDHSKTTIHSSSQSVGNNVESNTLFGDISLLHNTTIGISNSNTGGVDPNKMNQRLKTIFRERINQFREAVYLLTGYKVSV